MLKAELGPSLAHQFPFHSNFVENRHETLDLCNGGHEIVATNISEFLFFILIIFCFPSQNF
jgi:hypothetical protein